MAESDLIKLMLFQGTGSVWNLEDWRKMRHHKIIGNFAGCLAHQPYQVKEKGFPLILTKNETTLLIKKHLAVLLTSKKISNCPDVEIMNSYKQKQHDSLLRQSGLMQNERKLEILNRSEMIITGKLNKRRKLDPDFVFNDAERASIIQEEIAKIAVPLPLYMLIELSTEEPWLNNKSWKTIEWAYPVTEDEQLEYSTFCSLWEKNLWVTPGSKFGGTFLAYSGNPVHFHSSYIVRCTKKNESLQLIDLIALSRLATSTNKIPILAYFDTNGIIKFQSVSWLN